MMNLFRTLTLTHYRYAGLMLSIILTLLSVIILSIYGLHLGLDFTGGVLLELKIQTLKSATELNTILNSSLANFVQLQYNGIPGEWLVKLPPQENGFVATELVKQISAELNLPVELSKTTIVGPQVGADLFEQGLLALLAASVAISVYLAFRFEWRQAIGVLLSVLHDAVIALGLLSWMQIEFDLNVIAGLMAVIGYSLNDSIVISDRLRDLLRSPTATDIYQCSNKAIKATFSRTLITSGTTLFTVSALLLFGGEALFSFSFTLFIGVLVGTVSSITIASTVQELLGLSAEEYQKKEVINDDGITESL